MWLKSAGIAAIAFLGGACDVLSPTNCTDIALAGLAISIVDIETGSPIVADDVRVEVRDGLFVEVAEGSSNELDLAMAFERTGRYEIHVTAAGYLPWDTTGVRVRRTDDGCHVNTVTVTAALVREP